LFYIKDPRKKNENAIRSLVFSTASARPQGTGVYAAAGEHATWGDAGHGSLTKVAEDPSHRRIGLKEEDAQVA
jgi:hypothetical protein